MSTAAQPTAEVSAHTSAGAMRAGEVIESHSKRLCEVKVYLTADFVAEIIDRETAAPQLVDALKDAINELEAGGYAFDHPYLSRGRPQSKPQPNPRPNRPPLSCPQL